MSLRRAPLGNVAPDLDHLQQVAGAIQNRRGVDFLPGHGALRRAALADADLARARLQACGRRAVSDVTSDSAQVAAAAAQRLLAGVLDPEQKSVVGGYDIPARVQ